ncbi:MAG: SDR family oxidoreductase [Pseudomonadota bacterium]
MSEGITLITGGNRGIGLAISQTLVEAGHHVVSFSRQEPESFSHPSFRTVKVDLASREATRKAAQALAAESPVLTVIHNAGVIRPARVEEASLEDLDYLTELHLGCMLQLVQAAIPGMKATGFGRIIGLSSRGALGLATRTNYSATKAGMFGMLRTWALELGSAGITANCVAPGPIRSDMFDEIMGDDAERVDRLASAIPVGRIGQPEDVAAAVKFFASKEAAFVTGQVLYVCGGSSIGSIVI